MAELTIKEEFMTDQKWVVVYTTYGMFEADVIVGRLQTEGIPARAYAESAGRAIGLTVGKLGTCYIEVPEIFVEEAETIIDMDFSDDDEDAPENAESDDDTLNMDEENAPDDFAGSGFHT